MTEAFAQMLRLAAMGATGKALEMGDNAIQWETVVEAARRQKTECLLAQAVKHNPALACPAQFGDRLTKVSRTVVLTNAMRKRAIIQLLQDMEAAGIRATLLKGYVTAACYALPESRISGDADVWIDPKDEDRACEFMRKRGFSVEPRWKNGHHAVCEHPTIGCVELHVILYDEIVEGVWFGKMDGAEFVCEPRLPVQTEDGVFHTLGYTDHFIFLALHMIKHFILSGLTVQMMLDVALYLKTYAAKIDMDRVWRTINSLHYDILLNSIFWAMIRYGGFAQQDFPGVCEEAPALVETILTDQEEGGWLGFANKSGREEGWFEYNRQMMLKNKSKAHYYLYMVGWKWDQYMNALFPTRDYLAKRYPYLHTKPWLLPVAWLHRLIFRGTRSVRQGVLTNMMVLDENAINDNAKKRVELFRDLHMM